jgi:hypothetical protein
VVADRGHVHDPARPCSAAGGQQVPGEQGVGAVVDLEGVVDAAVCHLTGEQMPPVVDQRRRAPNGRSALRRPVRRCRGRQIDLHCVHGFVTCRVL